MERSPQLVFVPHTHWDREWYEPHDVFRLRLVHMMDGLLGLLETYPQYRFTLDGQAAALDDYLEMRPESLGRVERAVAAGQLAVGPFLILLDEFACDGETIIRNLELGIESSRKVGPEMRLGYLPDMFGHAAQMPQILRGFGIANSALWRGVPRDIESSAFWWESLGGERVRCQYLFDGYGAALDLLAIKGQLPHLAKKYTADNAAWYGPDDTLAMLGSDHSSPFPDLVERIESALEDPDCPAIDIETIAGYVTRQDPARPLPTAKGELRSHFRGNLLPGVFSIRTNLKQAMSDAERALTIAERLDVLFPSANHQEFLRKGWYRTVESTAHDSVTGCGVDATSDQVENRLHTAAHIARGVQETALRTAAEGVAADRQLAVNPSGFARLALAEYTVSGDDVMPAGAQVLEELPTVLGDEDLCTADLVKLLRRIHGRELFGQQINDYRWGERELTFDVAEVPVGEFDLAQFTAELEQVQSEAPADDRWRVRIIAAPRTRVLAPVELAGLGAALVPEDFVPRGGVMVRGSASQPIIKNSALKVQVNPDGTVDVFRRGPRAGTESTNADGWAVTMAGALTLVDEGDRGDSYNYGPTAHAKPIWEPAAVSVDVLEEGPLRGRILIRRTYDLPVGLSPADPDCRLEETASQVVDTVVELRVGEEFVRTEISLVNRVTDHRLRVLVPAGVAGIATSASAGQYGVTQRGRQGEGGWGEYPLPTFPATQFVSTGTATVLLQKLTEYEVVPGVHPEVGGVLPTPSSEELADTAGTPALADVPATDQDSLAITLVRSVGMMSVNIHPLRDEPAGSQIPVPGAQYLDEKVVTHLALLPSPEGWEAAQAPRQADLFRLAPLTARGEAPRGSDSVAPKPSLKLETKGSVPLVSLRKHQTSIEARFVNYDWTPQPLDIVTDRVWMETNLAGDLVEGSAGRAGSAAALRDAVVPPSTILTMRAPGS